MKYHVSIKGVKAQEALTGDFDYAEVNVVKEIVFIIRKIDGHQVLQYSFNLNEVAEVTIVPYEDNEQKIPRC